MTRTAISDRLRRMVPRWWLPERADIYRPDPVTGALPNTPTLSGVACAVIPIARLPLLAQAGGGPIAPVRWDLRFPDGTGVQARDVAKVTTFSPVVAYTVVTMNDPHTNSLVTGVYAEELE